MRQLGTHLVVELVGCEFDKLDNVDMVSQSLVAAAQEARATVLDTSFHRFTPQGVSGVVVLAESHISIHTWPEEGYAAIDVFTCGDHAMPHKAVAHMIEVFQPVSHEIQEIPRGIPAPQLNIRSDSFAWNTAYRGWA